MKKTRLFPFALCLCLLAVATPAWAASGDPDTSFSGDGVFTFGLANPAEEGASGIAVDPSGRLLVGASYNASSLAVARILPAGTLDPAFNGGITQFPGPTGRPTNAVAAQPDGKVLAVGQNATGDLFLARYRGTGLPDPNFNGDGLARVGLPSTSTTMTNILVRSDDSILVPGWIESAGGVDRMYVLAFKPNGALDQSFAGDGQFFLKIGDRTIVRDATLDDHDRITLVAETETNGDPFRAAVTRILSNGKLDDAFSGDGTARFDLAAGVDDPRAIAPRGGGSVLVAEQAYDAGGASADGRLFAVTGGGRLDTSYSGNGTATFDLAPFDNPWDLRLDGSGRAYVATTVLVSATNEASVVRTKPNGALDISFSGDGVASVAQESNAGGVRLWHGDPTIVGYVNLTTDFDALVARFLSS
jgi:uncharacterized delta-60 repeat protein